MYKVFCDDTLMCDSRVEDLALINPVIKPEESKAGSFSFTIPSEHPYYDMVERRKSIIEVYEDDELLFSGECIKVDVDFYKQKKISCEGEFAYFNDSIQRPARYQGVTVRGLLEAYVANHNAQVDERKHFEVGIVTVTDPNDYLYCYTNMESTMKCLKEDLVDNLGGFFRVRHENRVRYLDYLAESLNTCSQIIKLGKNLIDFKSNIDSTEIATAIIPLGAKLENSAVEGLETRLTIESVNDGKDYVFSQDAVDAFGWIQKAVEWNNVTTAENLKAKGEKYLADIQFENIVIEAKAIDLHFADDSIERFKISDQIRVLSVPHGMDRYFRLTKMTLYLNDPAKNTITLGKNEKLTLTARNNQANSDIKKAIEAISPNSIVKEAVANATQIIQNAMNGYVKTVLNEDGTAKELLIMDTPSTETATKVWRWNINGLGYSSTGYNGEYALAMTMDGHFVADAITVDGLEVGKNVKMGENATISWRNVTDQPTIPSDTKELKNGAGYIDSLKATQITKDTVSTTFVNALKVTADKIAAGTGKIAGWDISDTDIYKEVNLYADLTEAGLAGVGDNDPVQYIVWLRKPTAANTATFYIGYRFKSYYLSGGRNWYTLFAARPNGEVMANNFKSNNAEITGGNLNIGNGRCVIASDGTITSVDAFIGPWHFSGSTIISDTSSFQITKQPDGTYVLSSRGSAWFDKGMTIQGDAYVGNGFSCHGGATVYGNLIVSGEKSRQAKTKNYGERLLYCYETPSPLFGDIGEGVIDETGKCYVFLDDIFSETVDTECEYQVFLQPYGQGNCYVGERTSAYFVVYGTKNLVFGWEIKCIQKGYDTIRLEESPEPTEDTTTAMLTETSTYLNSLLYNVESEEFSNEEY